MREAKLPVDQRRVGYKSDGRRQTMAGYSKRSLLFAFTVAEPTEEEADMKAHDAARAYSHKHAWAEGWEMKKAKRFIQQRNGKPVYCFECFGQFDLAEALRRAQEAKAKTKLTKEEALAELKRDQNEAK